MKKRIACAALGLFLILGACASGAPAPTAGGGDAAAGTATGAGADSGEGVTINIYWWGNQTRNDLTQKVIDLYMAENPGVVIKGEFTEWSGYWDKLAATTAGGNMPDIVQMDYSYLLQYADSGQLASLNPFIESGVIDVSAIPGSIIESGKVGDACYALSLGSNAPVFMYDKETVEAAGVTIPEQMTFSELYEIGEIIHEKTGVKTYFDGGINMLQIVARSRGSHIFEELAAGASPAVMEHYENVVRFNDAPFAISVEHLAEKNPDVVETKPMVDQSTWNDFSYSNQYISVKNAAGRDIGISMYPKSDNASVQPMFLKPSQFFSISEKSPHKEEAAKFLNWFTNSVEANTILMGERGVPINPDVAEAIKEPLGEDVQMIFDYISRVGEIATPIDDPDPKGKGEIEALIKSVTEGVRYGDLDAAAAAEDLISQSHSILQSAN